MPHPLAPASPGARPHFPNGTKGRPCQIGAHLKRCEGTRRGRPEKAVKPRPPNMSAVWTSMSELARTLLRRMAVRPRQQCNRRCVPRDGTCAREQRCFAPCNDINAPGTVRERTAGPVNFADTACRTAGEEHDI